MDGEPRGNPVQKETGALQGIVLDQAVGAVEVAVLVASREVRKIIAGFFETS